MARPQGCFRSFLDARPPPRPILAVAAQRTRTGEGGTLRENERRTGKGGLAREELQRGGYGKVRGRTKHEVAKGQHDQIKTGKEGKVKETYQI